MIGTTTNAANAADVLLAQLTAQGDRHAFGELVRRSAPAVNALLRRMGSQQALADDIAQDAYIAAMRHIHSYRGDAPFAAWMMRIAARLYLKRRRSDSRLEVLADPIDHKAPAKAHPPEESLDLDAALATLSNVERMCVSLCHGAGLTHAEIATALQVPLGTVKSHVTRGMNKLRKRLDASVDVSAPSIPSERCT